MILCDSGPLPTYVTTNLPTKLIPAQRIKLGYERILLVDK